MDTGIYPLTSGLINNFNRLSVVANNVANGNTTGYLKDDVVFEEYVSRSSTTKYYIPNPTGSVIDVTGNGKSATGRALDVAINGPGFFVVKTAQGLRYTKNGAFTINSDNTLVDSIGNPVVSVDGQEITFEDGDTNPNILNTGQVLVDGLERGAIGIVEFSDVTKLQKVGDSYLTSNEEPNGAEKSNVAQGVLDNSNVNTVQEMTNLIELQRIAANETDLINNFYALDRAIIKAYSRS